MRKITMSLALCFLGLAAWAQPKTLQIDINEVFAHYQNAFNNTTQAYNNLVKGYKKSSRPSDVHYYFQSAKKYANDSRTYLIKAVSGGEELQKNAKSLGCEKGHSKISQMLLNFSSSDTKMNDAIRSMNEGITTENIQELGTHLQAAVQSLQSGVKKLNLAIEELNGATAELAGCKK